MSGTIKQEMSGVFCKGIDFFILIIQLDVNGKFDDVSKPQSLAFSPDGALLAVGFTNGSIRILDSISLSLLTDKCDFRYVVITVPIEISFDAFLTAYPGMSYKRLSFRKTPACLPSMIQGSASVTCRHSQRTLKHRGPTLGDTSHTLSRSSMSCLPRLLIKEIDFSPSARWANRHVYNNRCSFMYRIACLSSTT